jgi:chromosome segregation ATPase
MTAAQGIGNIRFAVGLREENPDALVARVFPMTKIIPVQIKEKKPKKVVKKQEEKACSRPDCAARKDKLSELKDVNKFVRDNLRSLETKLETTRNKIALTEKSILMAEEKNDTVNGQIEEAQNRIISIQSDVDKAEVFNQTLRRQLQALQHDIENINSQTVQATSELQDLLEDKTERKIVFSKDQKHRDVQLATEVSTLRFPQDGNDSD